MTPVRLALIATAAAGLTAIVAPASATIPRQATASVAPVSNCRLINFEDNEYQPEYTTVCGPQ
jgi:hypothetical protein